jgi:hypothetical protein
MIIIEGKPEYVYYAGSTFTVEWYMDARGKMKAKEYYDGLPEDDQERLDELVKYIAESLIGTHLPKTLYNEEDAENKIYAFKPRAHRFFNFMTMGRKIIILDAYRKHSKKMAKKDKNLLKTVIIAKHDFENSVKAGLYYDRIA